MNLKGDIRLFLGDDSARISYSETRTSLSIDIVMVPPSHRGQGIGTALIARVLLLADLTGREVYLSARPLGNASQQSLERLVRYYDRFGFEEYDRGVTVAYMRRRPTSTPSVPDACARHIASIGLDQKSGVPMVK